MIKVLFGILVCLALPIWFIWNKKKGDTPLSLVKRKLEEAREQKKVLKVRETLADETGEIIQQQKKVEKKESKYDL